MKYTQLTEKQQKTLIEQMAVLTNLHQDVIEKDWWVTQVLRAVFSLPYAEQLSFKGGTSLSKCWHIINRFSEDIDIAVSRDFLGYGGTLSRTQISDKLRRAACSFVREKMQFDLRDMLIKQGIAEDKFNVTVNITPISTTDPETIIIEYDSALPESPYIKHCVLIEVSGRSMQQPVRCESVNSLIDQYLPQTIVAEESFCIPNVVTPERTFLEKIFLIHEEFHKPENEIRTNRMSRHLYDIVTMMKVGIDNAALSDANLYRSIVEHRRHFVNLKDFDYDTLYPTTLTILPPDAFIDLWRKDYAQMQLSMIYGEAPTFDEIMSSLNVLQQTIRKLPYGK
ncbi:MAG: nucleotidyl transferase AbiEii/AbiGii toxin family protein [Bacteroidales bacterium]|nr:nucleotidyl transferase AbiEii/AbiGii toxin family protein [Bacteroidales bacterium]